jgi:aspartyl-tRNA(Asn)/glutamyl-tRNA(Gln) amidotransferase subunit B
MLVPTIGIEVHVELKSNAKVFSKSKNNFKDAINTNVSVIDLGYPGVLPQLNKKVIDMALQAALVLNCEINKKMHFDRKNYFYPDLPKGYQITQSRTPIGHDGYVTIYVDGKEKKIGIERIHIEEDTCKSIHNGDMTLLNFNRAGVPLIEIVSKPDITSSKEAVLYIEALREMLLYLGISDVKIEEGSMRCDANVSLKEETSVVLGTKTEIKNIGSISNVGSSIEYEIKRQREIIENGGTITEETRRYDDKTSTTILMRVKETGNDYRYFPEPDIPFVTISEEWINDAKERIPVLPDVLRGKYLKFGINNNNINTLISNIELCDFLEAMGSDVNPVIGANLLCGGILEYLNKNYLSLKETKLDIKRFGFDLA